MPQWETDSELYRRQDGFRLAFKEPLPAYFTILQIKGKEVESKKGTIHLFDMSLKGAKIFSPLEIPTPKTQIQLECVICEEQISLVGELIWRKASHKGFIYGMTFDASSYWDRHLLEVLQNYVRQNK